MAERRDQNKTGIPGRDSASQPGRFPEQDQQESNRRATPGGPDIKPDNSSTNNFNLVVDSVPYLVQATPFAFNGETRYTVVLNGGTQHIFTWDSDLKRLTAIDDDASVLPEGLEEAISEKLQAKARFEIRQPR